MYKQYKQTAQFYRPCLALICGFHFPRWSHN